MNCSIWNTTKEKTWFQLQILSNLRKNSKTFGKIFTFELSEKNSYSIFVPPGFAHGFQCLDKENYVVYRYLVFIDYNHLKLMLKIAC